MRPREYRFSASEVLEVYAGHPLSLATIRARLDRQGKRGDKEDDLAFDSETETTDQNHIGAAEFVLELAAACGLSGASKVLDLGCGIGGPARLIADRFGCAVHGVDLSQERIDDARELTRMTGLTSRVTFECSDFMNIEPKPAYSVVWGENSWIHISDRERLLLLASQWLVAGGRVAFEDVCLQRPIRPGTETEWFATISDAWRSSFATVEEWQSAFTAAGLEIMLSVDRTQPFIEHYMKLVALADANPSQYPAHEGDGWRCAKWLAQSGAFCFRRIVGAKPC